MVTEMENIQIRKRKDTFIEIDKLAPDKRKFWQIDMLKVFAIALVIMDHSTSHGELYELASPLWERIAIPMFMIILGFNWAKSLARRKDEPLYKLYSWRHYFKKKLMRFGIPFGVIYVLSGVFYILIEIFNPATMDVGNYGEPILKTFLFLPVWGPGNWFIPTLFLTILIFPIIFKAFTKQPALALIGCFILEIFYHLFVYKMIVEGIESHPEWNIGIMYTFLICTPFVLLSAIGLGVWLSQDHNWESPRNIFLYFLGFASFIYLLYYTYDKTPLNPIYLNRVFGFVNGDYNFFVYPWSALIIFLALNIFPKEPSGKSFRFITLLSNSTYHILMTQMFYFSIIYTLFLPMFGNYPIWTAYGGDIYWVNYLWYYPVNVVITFTIGILWYKLEKKFIWDKIKLIEKKRLELVKYKNW